MSKKDSVEATEKTESAAADNASKPDATADLVKRLQELEAENAKLKADNVAVKEAQKTVAEINSDPGKMVKVVSATDYNYMVEGQTVTSDKPVSLLRKEGNYLDCQMKAGLIVEYEA